MRPSFLRKFTSNKSGYYVAFAVALLLVIGIPLFSNTILQKAFAGTLSQASITISDSRASATNVNYRVQFRVADTTPIEYITMQFCDAPSLSPCTPPAGLDLSGTDGAGTGITMPGTLIVGNINAGTHPYIHLDITSPSTPSTSTDYGVTFTGITNTSATNSSFYVNIRTYDANSGGNLIDSVWVASAVLDTDSIAVTADIGAAFTFTVAGVTLPDGSSVPDSAGFANGTELNIDTTDTTIAFGSLGVGTSTAAAHDLTVITNASNGYLVTLKFIDPGTTDAPLNDGSNNIDSFTGTNASPTAWADPSALNSANNGSGYFGYTTEDFTLTSGSTARFNGNLWAGMAETPEEIMASTSSTPTGGDSERVGWRIAVNSQQPAGNYTGTLILVATPTY